MADSGNGQSGRTEKATRKDLQQILGDMDDETAVVILALDPNVSQIEEVGVWLSGDADVLGKEGRPFDMVVAKILELVEIVEDESSVPKR